MSAHDPHDLQRFVDAQQPVYAQVIEELRRGTKTGHWMWFIFPQVRGLGHSSLSERFGISSLEEAAAYLRHPILGPRLRECTSLVMGIERRSSQRIFGCTDNLKFRSSMTLFAQTTGDDELFEQALRKFYSGKHDDRTIEILGLG